MASQLITTKPIKIFSAGASGLVHASHDHPFLVKQTNIDQTTPESDPQKWRLMQLGESLMSNSFTKDIWIAARKRDVERGVPVTVEVDT